MICYAYFYSVTLFSLYNHHHQLLWKAYQIMVNLMNAIYSSLSFRILLSFQGYFLFIQLIRLPYNCECLCYYKKSITKCPGKKRRKKKRTKMESEVHKVSWIIFFIFFYHHVKCFVQAFNKHSKTYSIVSSLLYRTWCVICTNKKAKQE